MPKSVQAKAKSDLHEIYRSAGRQEAEKAMDRFIAKYGAKYDRATECLTKDRTELLAFYDFPAEPFAASWLRPFYGSDQRPPGL